MLRPLAASFRHTWVALAAVAACSPDEPAIDRTNQALTVAAPIGTLPGDLEVTATGAASYEIPIDVPPGRKGLEPRLTLAYNSRDGNGLVGVGWSLRGISRITRCASTPAHGGRRVGVLFYSGDQLCLDGAQLVVVSGTYGTAGAEYRTVPDRQLRIVTDGVFADGTPTSFTVYHREGEIEHFTGRLEGAQVSSSSLDGTLAVSPTQAVFGWVPELIEDRSGNSMTIEWAEDVGPEHGVAKYPTAIRYTYGPGGVTSASSRMVRLEYEARPDWLISYVAGFRHQIYRRLSAIETYADTSGTLELVHRYRIGYKTSATTQRSVVSQIEKCDPSDVCLPKTVAFSESGDFAFAAPITVATIGEYARIRTADITGDGRDDVLWRTQGDPGWRLQIQTDAGFAAPIVIHPYGQIVALVDYDQNGTVDIIREGGALESDVLTWMDGGLVVVQHIDGLYALPQPPKVADLDGDGAPDLVGRYTPSGSSTSSWWWMRNTGSFVAPFAAWASTGLSEPAPADSIGATIHVLGNGATQVAYDAGIQFRFLMGSGGSIDAGFMNLDPAWGWQRFLDINGDGLDDVLDLESGKARLNTGAGFGPPYSVLGFQVPWTPPRQTVPAQSWSPELDPGFRILDLNNDGRMDLVRADGGGLACLSRGITMECFALPEVMPDIDVDVAAYPFDFLDVDGDGIQDLIQIHGGVLEVRRRTGKLPDRITSMRNGLGMTDTVTYKTTTDPGVYTPGPRCGAPQRCNVRGFPLVARVDRANGSGSNPEIYSYVDGRFDLRGEGFIGFARTRRDDSVRGRIVEQLYSISPTGDGRYPWLGLPARQTIFQRLTSDHVRVITTTFTTTSWGTVGGSYFARTTAEDRREYEWSNPGGIATPAASELLHAGASGMTPVRRVTVRRDFDAYANELYESKAVDGGSTNRIDRVYENRTDDWLIGLATHITRTSTAADGTSDSNEVAYVYDALGRRTRETVEPTRPAMTSVTNYGLASDGLVERIDRSGPGVPARTELLGYDSQRVFVVSSTNAAGHVTTTSYHAGLGVLERMRDPNGAETVLEYDTFGRLSRRRDPDGKVTTITIAHEGPPSVAYRVRTDRNTGERLYVDFDGLGRPTTTAQLVGSSWTLVRRTYDAAGRLQMQSLPYFDGTAPAWMVYTRDQMGRVLRADYPDGSVERRKYTPFAVETWDATNRYLAVERDLDGQLSRSIQNLGGRDLVTRYAYGPFGRLRRVTDSAGRVVDALEYDSLGRRTRLEDADAGKSSYTYNPFGELVSVIDSLGRTTIFKRDLLGRVGQIVDVEGKDTYYKWDAAIRPGGGHVLGKIAEAKSPDGVTTTFAYDAIGRAIGKKTTVDGEAFSVSRWFDGYGRVGGIRYPNSPLGGLDVVYEYGADGLQRRVRTGTTIWWEAQRRDAWLHVALERVGSSAYVERKYEPFTGRVSRILSYRWIGSGKELERDDFQDLSLTYQPNGHLASRVDHLAGRTETFGYDDLQRLTGWTVIDGGTLAANSYTYDDLGNMLTSTGLDGHHVYGHGVAAGPHAVTSVDGGMLEYDALGRRIREPGSAIDYTPFDLPARIESDSGVTTFSYDAFHVRTSKQSASGSVVYVDGLYERRVKTAPKYSHHFFIRAGGRLVAELVEHDGVRETRYLHPDQLGSANVITDAGASVAERRWYTPFGQLATPATPGLYDHNGGFTGHEGDWADKLVNMRGRIYDPRTRRFMTPDPVISRAALGQRFNRYSYVMNMPLSFVDPTGFEEDGPDYIDDDGVPWYDFDDGYDKGYDDEAGGEDEEETFCPPAPDFGDDYDGDSYDDFDYSDADVDGEDAYGDGGAQEEVTTDLLDQYPYSQAPSEEEMAARRSDPDLRENGTAAELRATWFFNHRALDFVYQTGDRIPFSGPRYAVGVTLEGSLVIGTGGSIGVNAECVGGSGCDVYLTVTQSYGLSVGASLTGNVAMGHGPWTGESTTISGGEGSGAGGVSGTLDGWTSVSAGFSAGIPVSLTCGTTQTYRASDVWDEIMGN